jgi:hypothetical protein
LVAQKEAEPGGGNVSMPADDGWGVAASAQRLETKKKTPLKRNFFFVSSVMLFINAPMMAGSPYLHMVPGVQLSNITAQNRVDGHGSFTSPLHTRFVSCVHALHFRDCMLSGLHSTCTGKIQKNYPPHTHTHNE